MIPIQTEYENNQIEPQYIGILEQNNLFSSDQKHVFNQSNGLKNMSNINDDNIPSSCSKNMDDGIHYKTQMGGNYKVHHQDQASSCDLFGSEFKIAKNNLIDYDTPSRVEFFDGKMCQSNNIDCKKLIFLNDQSSLKETQNYGSDDYNSISKLPQNINETQEISNVDSINHQYLINLPKKNLFNYLLESGQKNQTNTNPLSQDKSLRADSNIQESLHSQSAVISSQKEKSASTYSNLSVGDKHQTQQQSEQSTDSDLNGKKNTDQMTSRENISQRNNEMKTSSSQQSALQSNNIQYPNYYSNQNSSQSHRNSRVYNSNSTHYSNRNLSSSHPNSNESNNTSNSHVYSRYPYYGNSANMYPHPGSHLNHHSSKIPHHAHMLPHYDEYDMDYVDYNDIYENYYYPPYLSISPDHIDSKKKEGDQSKNINQQSKQDEMIDQYNKYYYGHGTSIYGYYPPPPTQNITAVGSQQPPNTDTSSSSKNEQNGITLQDVDLASSNPQRSDYQHQDDKYEHHSYIRGYYDHKGYYPPIPPPSYYYPPMSEMYNTHQGSKKNSKRSVSGSNEQKQLNQQQFKNMKSPGQTAAEQKYGKGQEVYDNHIDASYHSAYPVHPHHMNGSMIYCDSSYYQDQPHQKSISQINYKKPHHTSQSNKENILNKSSQQNKVNKPLSKEKNNGQSKPVEKLIQKVQQSQEANKKLNQQVLTQSKQNEQEENTDQYELDNQDSSQQNGLSSSHEIRKRKRKNNDQLKILKIEYQKGGFWGKEKITEVAQFTGLSESQVYKWCWDQKKKRLETFKKRLGNKLGNGASDQQFEDMSGEEEEEESYKQTGSPEKMIKLNDERGIVPIKTNISKLSNDFTINQLQEKVLTNKNRPLQNITDKVLSRQNSKQENTKMNQKNTNQSKQINNTNVEGKVQARQNQENIHPDNQQLDDVSKRLHFNSAC